MSYLEQELDCDEVKADLSKFQEMIDNGEATEDAYTNCRPTGITILEYMQNFGGYAIVDDGSVTTMLGSLKKLKRDQLLEWFCYIADMRPDEFDICTETQTYRAWWD